MKVICPLNAYVLIHVGGEFNSEDFNKFCKQHGLKRQLTAAYTSQQNGVAE